MKKGLQKNVVPFRQDAEFFFKVGVRHADRKVYGAALKYLTKAADMEPYNPDFQFNLAGVLAEMKEIEKSNKILLGILKNIDPTMTECYFGIGCNYFDMENFQKAKEYFEKYLYFDPEGAFADEVYDVLYYLQIYDDVGGNTKKNRTVYKLASEGKKLLTSGEYKKASVKLEKAIEIDPEVTTPRNDLSLIYFLTGDIEKAISVANSVLKLDPQDVYANCNLALFYAGSGKFEQYKIQVRELDALEINEGDEAAKLVDTYVRLREYKKIHNVFKKFTGEYSDIKKLVGDLLADENLPEEDKEIIGGIFREKTCSKQAKSKKASGGRTELPEGRLASWSKEWEDIINCAIQRKEGNYRGSYKKELKTILANYFNTRYKERPPVIKKAETWAAALEYIYCKHNLIDVSKKKLADKYKVSESAINSRIKDFCK